MYEMQRPRVVPNTASADCSEAAALVTVTASLDTTGRSAHPPSAPKTQDVSWLKTRDVSLISIRCGRGRISIVSRSAGARGFRKHFKILLRPFPGTVSF